MIAGEPTSDRALWGESDVEVNVSNHKSPEDIVNEGVAIHEKVRRLARAGLSFSDEKRLKELETDLRKAHPDFSSSFPIPFRWIVNTGEFEPRVFYSWLIGTQAKKMWDSENAWIESQATYLVRLQKHRRPQISGKELAAYSAGIVRQLKDERAKHRKHVEESKLELEREDADTLEDLRARLKSYCARRSGEQLSTRLHQVAELETEALDLATLTRAMGQASAASETKPAAPETRLAPAAAPEPETKPAAAPETEPAPAVPAETPDAAAAE